MTQSLARNCDKVHPRHFARERDVLSFLCQARIKGNDTVPMLLRNEHFKDIAPKHESHRGLKGGAVLDHKRHAQVPNSNATLKTMGGA